MAVALLKGKSAPELSGVAQWIGGKEIRLESLRGNYVILDFWGFWCGPCIKETPRLIDLHDRYSSRGLRVLSLHVGTDEEQVTTSERFNERISGIQKLFWNNRRLPFPVALLTAKKVEQQQGGVDYTRSEAAADYGVTFYPSYILIGRNGKVVGNFDLAYIEGILKRDLNSPK